MTPRPMLSIFVGFCALFVARPSAQLPLVPGIDRLTSLTERFVNGPPALTTDLAHAHGLVELLPDDYEPEAFYPVTWLDRAANGSFALKPGAWEFQAESYCLLPGSRRPSAGDGWADGTLQGPRADIIRHILEGAGRVPAIPQADIQTLIWDILLRADVRYYTDDVKRAAAALLTPSEVTSLATGTIGHIAADLVQEAAANLSPAAQQIIEAQAEMREMIEQGASYADLERVAVPEDGESDPQLSIPRGRWILRDGYFLRYLPTNFAHVTVQIYVPGSDWPRQDSDELRRAIGAPPRQIARTSPMVPVLRLAAYRPMAGMPLAQARSSARPWLFWPGGSAAVPGDAGQQRLGISSRAAPDWDPAPNPGPTPKPPKPPGPPKKDPPPPDDKGKDDDSCRNATPEQDASAASMFDSLADTADTDAHLYDDEMSSSCPPPQSLADLDFGDGGYGSDVLKSIDGNRNSSDPNQRWIYQCTMRNLQAWKDNQQRLCDTATARRARLLNLSDEARKEASQYRQQPAGASCALAAGTALLDLYDFADYAFATPVIPCTKLQ